MQRITKSLLQSISIGIINGLLTFRPISKLELFQSLENLQLFIMNLVNYVQFLEPMQDQFLKIYSTMSGIIAVLFVLWTLNFIAGLIQRTYSTGKAFGGFYRNYLHRYLKVAFIKFISLVKIPRPESTA